MGRIEEKIRQAPSSPGVYLFKDKMNKPIYIGKALDLKKRLASYLARTSVFLTRATELDVIITDSDVEALTLEESLIKLHKPRYNVRLKDDKKFPYLIITVEEEYPRILFTRDLRQEGALIFGPYTNARALRQTRDALCRIFKLASCNKNLDKKYARPCLEHHLARCCAPCSREIRREDYLNLTKKAIEFLRGNSHELEKSLEDQMRSYAREENFEGAAVLRDQLLSLRKITQRQQIIGNDGIKRDVIGIARMRNRGVACLFQIRGNRLIAKETYHLGISPHVIDQEITSAFIRLIYTHLSFLPEEIVVSTQPSQWDIQQRWFRQKGAEVRIPKNPGNELRRLLNWAVKNAESELAGRVLKRRAPNSLIELQRHLNINRPLHWVEAFDVSNLKAKFAVGSSVAFLDGRPYKQRYRRYRIKRISGQNDFAMINEIVKRRVDDLKTKGQLPDLLLIDGGKAQLNAALQAISAIPIDLPIFALAKRSDQLYGKDGRVISIPMQSSGLILLKRLRDEAHRFAIGYHRSIRGKALTSSEIEQINGIGKKRKLILLKFFGSVANLRKASVYEIARVPGIGKNLSRIIYESLHT